MSDKKDLMLAKTLKIVSDRFLMAQIAMAVVTLSVIVTFALLNNAVNVNFFVLLGVFLLFLSIYFIIFIKNKRKVVSSYAYSERENISNKLMSLDSLVQLIVKLFFMLEKTSQIGNDTNVKMILTKAKPAIESIQQGVINWWDLKEHIHEQKDLTELDDTAKIKEISQLILLTEASLVEAMELFTNNYMSSSDETREGQKKLSTLIYYLSNTIPLISEFSESSNRFSRETIEEVIVLFEEIAQFSMHISQDLQGKMKELMDAEKTDSLVYIIQQTHSLVDDFQDFYQSLEKLKNVSNNFADTSIEKLNNIADFAVSIEDIAETIKVISLNVSIEAANTGSSARGFQVLARDLRVFAQKTLKFAGDVKVRVEDTIESTQRLKGEYLDNMNIVYDFVEEMKESIDNFKAIIESSFEKIQSIIMILQEFAVKIDEGLKHVIGKLQYYDITSQEVEHIGTFIEDVFETAKQGSEDLQLEDSISSEGRKEIQKSILESIKKIITTRNERKILDKYEEIYGTKVTSDEDSNVTEDITLF